VLLNVPATVAATALVSRLRNPIAFEVEDTVEAPPDTAHPSEPIKPFELAPVKTHPATQ
jgi:hypothetical protein